ncbi:hypothetical protein B0H13DRAFT_2483537 [Mycena leptocephala]|nr:hypothetical protein B0H13DRAFT_2483537 [Mycena leptocephala]
MAGGSEGNKIKRVTLTRVPSALRLCGHSLNSTTMTGFWDKHSEAVFGDLSPSTTRSPPSFQGETKAKKHRFCGHHVNSGGVVAKDAPTIVQDPVELFDVCEPIFPVELEQVIFETTALMHPTAIPALLRIARRVLVWIEPLLYRVVRIFPQNTPMVRALQKATNRSRQNSSTMRSIISSLNLLITVLLASYLPSARASSTSLQPTVHEPALLPILATMRVQRLSLNLNALFGPETIDLKHSLFQSVTHLDMFRVERVAEVLPDLPADIILPVLEICPRLVLLLVMWASYAFEKSLYAAARVPCVYDVRFVIGMYKHYWQDWEAGARGLPDSWSRADDFVARKRRGEIDGMVYSAPDH